MTTVTDAQYLFSEIRYLLGYDLKIIHYSMVNGSSIFSTTRQTYHRVRISTEPSVPFLRDGLGRRLPPSLTAPLRVPPRRRGLFPSPR